jgi:hypothetical protein
MPFPGMAGSIPGFFERLANGGILGGFAGLQRLSGLADFGQALLFVGDLAGHFVAATACAVEFVLLRVG